MTSVPLIAGGGVDDPSDFAGAFPFIVNAIPSKPYWCIGSANNNPYTIFSIGIYFSIS